MAPAQDVGPAGAAQGCSAVTLTLTRQVLPAVTEAQYWDLVFSTVPWYRKPFFVLWLVWSVK